MQMVSEGHACIHTAHTRTQATYNTYGVESSELELYMFNRPDSG